ncbi:hypothetical protein [uncultured Gemella sp.]|uniref:hypothetical protein n=1 Tax=uncultured Gemella sp. TaxID=254352 RepID=UPI0025D1F9B3|nr:hypothetical protein [uncultured Gemella sp.]
MAKYWENLKYHEDTVVKEKLSNDDIKFLKELQKELNTEDNVGTANPRYWVIRQPERIYHLDEDEADYYVFIDECDKYELTLEDLKDKLEFLCDDNLKSVEVKDGVLTFEYFDEWLEEVEKYKVDYDNSYTDGRDKILELLESDVSVAYYKEVDATVDNCMFLTQIDAENHLRANDYHYHEKARTYCMCGWRSPRFERLINILSKTDFDSMLEKN